MSGINSEIFERDDRSQFKLNVLKINKMQCENLS